MKKFPKIAFIALCATACAARHAVPENASELRIIGGKRLQANDSLAKSMVAIVDANGDVTCTGVVLNSRKILTAAHCTMLSGIRGLTIRTGLDARSPSKAAMYKVASVATHEDFDASGLSQAEPSAPTADLEVLTTEGDLNGVIPVLAAHQFDKLSEGVLVRMTGFGRSVGLDRSTSGLALFWDFKMESFNAAAKEMTLSDPANHMACHGDSGGPVFGTINGRTTLVGIVSRGSRNCDSNESIVTDLRSYESWILSHSH